MVSDDEVGSEPQTPPPRPDSGLYDGSRSPPAARGRLPNRNKRDTPRFVCSDRARQRSLELYRALGSGPEPSIESTAHLEAESREQRLEGAWMKLESAWMNLKDVWTELEMRSRRPCTCISCSACLASSDTVVSDSAALDETDLSEIGVNPLHSGEESDGPQLRLRSARRLYTE